MGSAASKKETSPMAPLSSSSESTSLIPSGMGGAKRSAKRSANRSAKRSANRSAKRSANRSARRSAKRKNKRGMTGGSSCVKMTGGRHKGKRHSRSRGRGRR